MIPKFNSVTALAGVFALVSVQNIAHFFTSLGHPVVASWTLGLAIGCALVILAHKLSEIDMRERKAFAGLLSVTLILVCLSGLIQGSAYSHELGGMGYLLAFVLAATGEIVLPLAHAWHGEAQRRRMVNDAGQRVEEIAAQTLVDTMAGVDVTRAQKQAEKRIEQLVIAHVDSIVHKLMPAPHQERMEARSEALEAEQYERADSPKSNAVTDLKAQADAVRSNGKQAAIERLILFYADNPNASLSEAGQAIERSKSTVKSYLDELQQAGRVFVNGHVEVL